MPKEGWCWKHGTAHLLLVTSLSNWRMNLEPPVICQTAAPKRSCSRAPPFLLKPGPLSTQSLASRSHTQCRVSSPTAMPLRAAVGPVDASALGSYRSGVIFVWTWGSLSHNSVDPAPPVLWTRTWVALFIMQGVGGLGSQKWSELWIHSGAIQAALVALHSSPKLEVQASQWTASGQLLVQLARPRCFRVAW